jgi:hypothetical protein
MEASRVHEGFEQQQRMPKAGLPIRTNAPLKQ